MSHTSTNNTKHRYFVYLRKSTGDDEKQQRSISDQLAEIRELVRKEQLEVVDFLEEMQSAKNKGRPVFNEMLARIEAGEADGIIAWHPDRLARNALDGGRIVDMLDEGLINDMRFCSFWFENTSQGKFMLMFAFGQGKYHIDMFSEGVKRAQRQKVAQGIWAWKAPLGYLNDPKSRTIVPDPVMAPLVTQMFRLYATGEYSIQRLRDVMNQAGLHGDRSKALSLCGCQTILKNPFYYGVFRLQGELHVAAHKPLVSKDVFDRCQLVMDRRTNFTRKPKLKHYVYRGLLRCAGCGCLITMETQKGHNYLRCTKRVKRDCPQPYLREEALTAQIAAAISDLSIRDDWADWMVAELQAERDRGGDDAVTDRQREQKEIAAIDKKLDRLVAAYLEAAAFTPTEFKNRKEELVNAKRVLLNKADARSRDDVLRFEPVIRFLHRSKQGKYVAARSDPAELRTEMKQIGSNLRLDNRTLVFDPRGAWKTVVKQGSIAHRNTARAMARAVSAGESCDSPSECPPKDSNLRPAD